MHSFGMDAITMPNMISKLSIPSGQCPGSYAYGFKIIPEHGSSLLKIWASGFLLLLHQNFPCRKQFLMKTRSKFAHNPIHLLLAMLRHKPHHPQCQALAKRPSRESETTTCDSRKPKMNREESKNHCSESETLLEQ